MPTENTAAAAVEQLRGLLAAALGPQLVTFDGQGIPLVALPTEKGGMTLVSLQPYVGHPRATCGISEFGEQAAFVAYVREYAGDNDGAITTSTSPRIFVPARVTFTERQAIATAYLDFPAKGSRRWSTHQARLLVEPSMEYAMLTALDGKLFAQDEFARKIRDLSRFCTSMDAATLLELAQSLTLASKGDFKSLHNDVSGAVTMLYDVAVTASAGTAAKKINVPETIAFNLPVLLGGGAFDIAAELVYRVPEQAGGKISLGIRLPDRKFIERDVLLSVVASLSKDTGLPVAIGETSVPQSYDD